MTHWFLDASVLMAAEDPLDPHRDAAARLLSLETPIFTLDFAYYECSNVAIRSWRNPGAASRLRRAIDAIEQAGRLVRIDSTLTTHVAELADQHGLSAYDAGYVAAASRVGATLVSCDLRDLVGPGHAITPEQALEA